MLKSIVHISTIGEICMFFKRIRGGTFIMEKIKMITPLVEMDGDEMTRILWKIIKDELIYPFILAFHGMSELKKLNRTNVR